MSKCTLLTLFLLLSAVIQLSKSQEDSVTSCSVESSCVVPEPLSSPNEASLQDVVRDIQCELGCLEQHAVILPLLNTNSPWPSLAFDALKENCPIYQKIYECKQGCKAHSAAPYLTVNRCRDNCFVDCEKATCNGQTPCTSQDNLPCGRQCRKTYCRFGCMLYDTLNTLNRTNRALIPPSSPPTINAFVSAESSPTQKRLYTVVPSDALSNTSLVAGSSEGGLPTTAYIVRISSPDLNHVSYLWQRNLTVPINLSPFACRKVSVSFAVVSKFTSTDDLTTLTFSPEATVCVPGLGGRPSQVSQNYLQVSYTEDLRDGFLGYSIANVSWQKPEGYEYVTSYTLTIYPSRDSCGGERATYVYKNINKEFTSFTVLARDPTGLLRFGCSYLYELVTQPAPANLIGPYISSRPTLTGPTPQIEVVCDKIWNNTSGHFDLEVSWNFQPETTPATHVTRFTLTPMLQNNSVTSTSYSPLTLTPQNVENQFSMVLLDYLPQTGHDYRVEIMAKKNSTYFWRTTPLKGSCTVSADPNPSDKPAGISVSGTTFNDAKNEVQFTLKWSHPMATYGNVVRYEVQVTNEVGVASGDYDDGSATDIQSFPAGTSLAVVTSILETNQTSHCVYVQMRAVNSYSLASEWSESLVIPLDDECLMDTSESTGKISLFYETDESGTVKLLELGCHSDSALFGGDTQSGLMETIRGIGQRVEDINSKLLLEEQERQRIVSLEQNLRRVEQKLDALIEIMATHVNQDQ